MADTKSKSTTSKNKEDKDSVKKDSKNQIEVVAITACPTGIAHTFMAAQAIEDKAKELGLTVKVETQGTEGSQNTLTQEEIDNAKAIIVAVDRNIDMDRFSGKEILQTSTSKAIKNAKTLIQNTLDKKGTKIYSASANSKKTASEPTGQLNFENIWGRYWKAIMTGVSYMLPFVVFGGITMALSFLIDINNAGADNFGSGNDVAKWFNVAGKLAMGMITPILGAYITYGLVGKVGLMPGFVMGLMARGDFTNSLLEGSSSAWYAPVEDVSSGFIGAVFGALLVATIVILTWRLFNKLPKSLNGVKNILLMPIITALLTVAIFWIVNIPFIYMSWGLQEFLGLFDGSPATAWLLGLIVGFMMAIDMGGPINKAAYVVGITSIGGSMAAADNGGTLVMAMVMAGGMVPPLAIAFATLFGRKTYWEDSDKEAGLSNWILGLSFITEGAIPFATKYPKQIFPGTIIGAMVAGMLVGIFQITLAAPHGGVFVFALVSTSLGSLSSGAAIGLGIGLYLIAIIAGTVVGGLIITFLMKRAYNNELLPTQKSEETLNTVVNKKSITTIFKKRGSQKANMSIENIKSKNILDKQEKVLKVNN